MAKNNNIPAIRFKGFSDSWEQRKLLDLLAQPITDGPHETPNLVENGIPFISVDAIVDNKIDFSRIRGYITEEYDAECCKKYKPQLHDVYMVKSGSTTGKVAIVETADRFNIWSPLAAMRCGSITDSYFLYFLLQTNEIQNQVFDKASHGTQPNLSMRQLEKFDVMVPVNIDEQVRLGLTFKSLDNLITLHQRKLEKLYNIRNSMLEKMFPQSGSKYPKIRFAGFTDAWVQRKFSDVFVGLQNNTLSRADLNYDKGDIKNVHYGDVLIKFGEYIDVASAELPYINDSSIESKFAKSLLADGDIIIADTAEDETVGKCCEITNSDSMKLLSGLHTIAVRPQQKYASKFLGYYLNSSAYHSQLIPLMQGIKVTSISKSALQDTVLTVPTSIDEQGKIGECFSNIDDIITLHQRKLEMLNKIKISMLEKMFV